jgi:hypothetical protein
MDTIRAPRIPGTRRSGRFARWVAVLALAALAVVVFLPALVNGQVNRILRGVMARGVAEFRLVHAGLHRSDVAIAVDDGGTEGPPLEVASCVIAYRPLRLLAGHVDSATLGGVVLHVVATNGVFSVPAANLFAASDEPPEPFSLKRLLDLPVTLDRLSLGGHVVVHADGETLVIPVKVEAAIRNETGWDAIDASARLRFSSSALDVVVRCQPGAEAIHAQIRGHVASDALPVLLRAQLPEALRRAVVDMTAKTALSFDGAVLSRLDIEAQADVAAETTHGTFTLRPALTAAGDHEKIEASLTGLAADMGGVRIALDATNVVASLAKRTLEGTLALGIATNAPFAVSFNVTPGGFTAGLADSPGGAVSLGAIQATYAGVRFEAEGARDPATGDGSAVARFGFGALALHDAAGRLLGAVDTGATGEASASLSGGILDCKASASLDAIAIPAADAALSRIALDATYRVGATGETAATATARAGAAFRGVELAQLDATLQQTPTNGFALEASVAALGASGTLNATASFDDAGEPRFDVAVDVPEQALDFAPLHGIVPELAGYAIGGKLAASAEYHIAPDDQKGSLKVRFNDGTLNNPEQELSVSGIRASFEMPYLPSLASNSQFLGFKNLRAGPFSIDSGLAIFRMQSPQVWFLDKLVLDWCGGKVRGESTRIARANKNTWITLHADQLRLADLLGQFGIGSYVGEEPDEGGKLSGTIPMVVTQGKIVVRDGYFHSAPGKTGRIRLRPAPRILEMAGASIQTSLALDALTDFTYKWIRIVMSSEGEDLLLKFEMDGRPSNKLNYSVRDGEIVRSRNASKFEGLVLDTTFRIPLNELLSIALPLTKSLQDATNE